MKHKEALDRIIASLNVKGWANLPAEEKLAFLQEYENVMAAMQGRDAIPVRVITPEELASYGDGAIMGYYNHGKKEMRINPAFLENRKNITGVSVFSLPQVLETIAHEGRHAWQHYVVDHPEKKLVDRKTRLAMQMNFANYCSGSGAGSTFAFYEAQMIELDARRYAKGILQYMTERVEQQEGHLDLQFVATLRKCHMRESMLASRILKEVLTDGNSLDRYEEKARIRMAFVCPGVDFSDISMFAEVREFLKHKDMKKFVDGPCIKSAFSVSPVEMLLKSKVEKPEERVLKPEVGSAAERVLKSDVGTASKGGFREGKKHKLL